MTLATIAGIAAWMLAPREHEAEPLGLMTSLPIYWADGADFAALLDEQAELPFVRGVLERDFSLSPIDQLVAEEEGVNSLENLDRLLIVQPRGLSPQDNVALDEWVRGGGRLLYVIDPMLSGEYAAPIGDPRHPPVIGLIPPVLPRWGLTVEPRDGEPDQPYLIATPVGEVPAMFAGQIRRVDGGMGQCRVTDGALVAQCTVGAGRVTLVADATLFELVEGNKAQEQLILDLAGYAFD